MLFTVIELLASIIFRRPPVGLCVPSGSFRNGTKRNGIFYGDPKQDSTIGNVCDTKAENIFLPSDDDGVLPRLNSSRRSTKAKSDSL